jgi:hypothetical protein
MKRIRKKVIPLFVALLILVGVPLTSYEEVKATGVEEYLYYTYWDLMNSLYAMTGYDMKISESEIKNHGVSGKQAWKNFTTFVDNTAKIHWKLYSDAGSSAIKELKNLVNTVTQKGISISQELYDMLQDVFGYQVSNSEKLNKFDTSSASSVVKMITAVCGIQSGLYANSGVVEDVCNGYALNIVKDSGGQYSIFTNKKGYVVKDYVYSASQKVWVNLVYVYDGKEIDSGAKNALWVNVDGKCSSEGAYPYSARAPVTWVIKNGAFAGADVVSAQVSAGACPKEVPDVSPWIKHTDVPDEWRIVKPDEVPDPDDDNDGDALPVVIPIHPAKPDKPSETETEESTEKPDKDKSKDPSVIINPSTGNQIDPNTGLDIDPDTGYLIDPDTGDLIDPNTGKKVDKNKIKNRVKNLPSIASGAGNITKYFPFCIPWDIVALIKTMNAQKSPPVFHFEHYFKAIDYNFVVDVNLEDYWKYIKIFRWGLTIFFIIGLFFLTDKLTTFVHKMVG